MLDIVVVSYRTDEEVQRVVSDLKTMTGMPYALDVFDNSKNYITLSRALNHYAWMGKHPYIAFLNPDIAVCPEWGIDTTIFLETHPDIGCVRPNPFGPLEWGSQQSPSQEEMENIRDDARESDEEAVMHNAQDYAALYAFVVRRRDWERLHGFDERFTLYGFDHDFQDRLRSIGLQTVSLKRIPFWHAGSLSTKRAQENKEIDLHGEYVRIGEILYAIRDGRLKPWHQLTGVEKRSVQDDPRFKRIKPWPVQQ